MEPLLPGSKLARYELVEELARGGMGHVWKARVLGPEGFGKQVVLKVLAPGLAQDEAHVSMFLNEAKVMAAATHRNLVQVFDLGRVQDTWFIAMEYVHGANFRQILRKCLSLGRLPPVGLVARAVSEVAEALSYLHGLADEAGAPLDVVHRDVNPENVLLSLDGTTKLCDLGLAKAHWAGGDPEQDWAAELGMGKLCYLSPEQLGSRGRLSDHRTDIYSLGVTLYEALAGRRPFSGENLAEVQTAILSGDYPPLDRLAPWLPAKLVEIAERAMRRDPDERYQSAADLARDLETVLETLPVYPSARKVSTYLQKFLEQPESDKADGSMTLEANGEIHPDVLTPIPSAGEQRHTFSGRIEALDFFDFLQTLLVSRRRVVVELVDWQGRTGRLYVADGNIVQATFGDLEGEEAFYKCVALTGGAISCRDWEEPATRTIASPSEFLLLEAARLKDEQSRRSLSPGDEGMTLPDDLPSGSRPGEEDDDSFARKRRAALLFEEGLLLARKGAIDKALEHWHEAARLDPDTTSYQTNIRILERKRLTRPD